MMLPSIHLHRIHDLSEAPSDAYLIYNLDQGGRYYVHPSQYKHFAMDWCRRTTPSFLTMDLASAPLHALFFDLDAQPKTSRVDPSVLAHVRAVLKQVFLPLLPHFMYVVSWRADSSGLHLHLPECAMAHDDYYLLCERLQKTFPVPGYQWDLVHNVMLSGSGKPNQCPYQPQRVGFLSPTVEWERPAEGPFPSSPCSSFLHFWKPLHLRLMTMPVVTRSPLYLLRYDTVMVEGPPPPGYEDVAFFRTVTCAKSSILSAHAYTTDEVRAALRVHETLRSVESVDTRNRAIALWHRRLSKRKHVL